MRPSRHGWFGVLVVMLLILVGTESTQAQAPAQAPVADRWDFSYRDAAILNEGKARFDLRPFNEKVAGESGFVRLTPDGNSFALGTGAPVRFWAINSDVFRQDPASIDKNVKFLARMGVNMVRLHAQITPKGASSRANDVDEKEIDGIWRYVAAAKQQGIYLTISPYWAHNNDSAKWGIEGYGAGELYGLLFFDETLQTAYKSWMKALLTRPNPYTKIPLAQDPAVALLQIQNEDSLLFWTSERLKPPARAKLTAKFTAWAVAKYQSVDGALKAWDNFGLPGDNVAGGSLAMIDLWQMTQRQSGGNGRRVGDQLAFMAELQRTFYEGMAGYLRKDLGCKQLTNASNWRTADETRLDDAERWSNAGMDVIAANRYYSGGVHVGPNNGWRIDPGDKFSQKSALLDPRAMPFNLKQVVGHPTIITESTWVAPLAFAAEGPFLAAVYPSLTGVDAFYWFNDSEPEYTTEPSLSFAQSNGQAPLTKWTAMTPTILGGFPAASILFRGGYLKQGAPVVHEERSLASIWNREDPLIAEGPAFDPNRDPGVTPNGTKRPANLTKGVDPLAFLVGPVEAKYGGNPALTRVAPNLATFIDPVKKIIRSETGEITLDYGKGLCRVDAPKAQGVCGFLSQAGPIQLGDVGINSANPYAAILVVSLDGEPLATNHRTLVQVTTAARPTGWVSTPTEFTEAAGQPKIRGYEVTRTGTGPWQVSDTEVGLAVKNPNLTKATRLDPTGFATEAVPVTKTRTGLTLTLPPETMYLILE